MIYLSILSPFGGEGETPGCPIDDAEGALENARENELDLGAFR
jgi:hypothetical protein